MFSPSPFSAQYIASAKVVRTVLFAQSFEATGLLSGLSTEMFNLRSQTI